MEEFEERQTPRSARESEYSDRAVDDGDKVSEINIEPQRTKKPVDEKLHELTRMLAHQMAPNKIKDAERSGDKVALRDSVHRFRQLLDEDGDRDSSKYERSGFDSYAVIDRAEHKLNTIARLELDLERVCESREAELIQRTLKVVGESGLQLFLRPEVQKAQQLLNSLPARRPNLPILAMDKKTMTELKHYSKPSPLVHRVMQAALLMLGVDEGKTAIWTRCQAMCNPDGPEGLNRKLMQFNGTQVNPLIADRVRILLHGIQLEQIQRASPGAATFYVWVQGVLKENDEQRSLENDDDKEEELENDEETASPPPPPPTLTARTLQGRTAASLAKIIAEERKIFTGQSTPRKDLASPRHAEYRFD